MKADQSNRTCELPAESSYQKILSVLGVVTFWISLSSLLHERFSSDVTLPLDPFKDAKSRGSVIIWGILVCWPLFTLVNLTGWRLAIANRASSRWERLPQPFGLGAGLLPGDRKVYALAFTLAFYLIPYLHVAQFSSRFFFFEDTAPIWVWTKDAWFKGLHDYYLHSFYYGWFPFAVIMLMFAMIVSSIALSRALVTKIR
jgi:hypothetical protein